MENLKEPCGPTTCSPIKKKVAYQISRRCTVVTTLGKNEIDKNNLYLFIKCKNSRILQMSTTYMQRFHIHFYYL